MILSRLLIREVHPAVRGRSRNIKIDQQCSNEIYIIRLNLLIRIEDMAISKQKKKEILESISGALKKSNSIVFVNFHGLTVFDSTKIRKQLKSEHVGYRVTKKTLLRKALETLGIAGVLPELPGELAVTYGTDNIAPAREIYSFQQKLDNKLSILGGVFLGRFVSQAEMISIASIPPRETLYAQFLQLINSPLQRFAIAVSEIAKKKETI